MHIILQNLLKLQAFDFDNSSDLNEAQATELRVSIPQPFLGHYERLRARSKKGVAAVRNQVCTGCHMKIPIGTVAMLMRGEDIQLCDSCGRYLFLAEEPQATAPAPEPGTSSEITSPSPKRARRPRKPKAVVEAA